MAKLKVPSLQHLARNWHGDSKYVCKVLVRLAENPPKFGYGALFSAVVDRLVLHVPYEQVAEGIRRREKREAVRENLLSVLPLIEEHFDGIEPSFVQTIKPRYYPLARGIMIPFEPPLLYGLGGRIHFPWFSFWRSNPIAAQRLSLFVTLIDDLLLQDPDLEDAKFEILDFSSPGKGLPRELSVVDAKDIQRVAEKTKIEMLSVFAEGFLMAQEKLANSPQEAEEAEDRPDKDENQSSSVKNSSDRASSRVRH